MLFNSLAFCVFLPVVFVFYWLVFQKSLRWQNILIVVSSYVFYGWWDWRFLSLIFFSTLVDFLVAKRLSTTDRSKYRKGYLLLSLFVNLGLLGFFKYYNFFIESWKEAWSLLGIQMEVSTLKIILPVGISFYTFQTLSYTIDVYRKRLHASNDFIQFAAYVSFFPQLVAGPIERASQLLPQFQVNRAFESKFAISGLNLIIWGLFKKIVLADNCAFFVNQIFDNPGQHNSTTLLVGAFLFAFQIYGDFSGYSDIAIGTGRLFGFHLMTNFKFPYLSRDIAEFWRRWHISLSTWFRDYVYIPLGGSKGSFSIKLRNVFVVFLVSGFWHGANWTFVAWGGLHALLFLPLFIFDKHRTHILETKISLREVIKVFITFLLVTFAWIFFRADSINLAFEYLIEIFSLTGSSLSFFVSTSKASLFILFILISFLVMIFFEFDAVQKNKKEVELSMVSTIIIALMIIYMGVFKNPMEFIYFQF